MKAVMKNSAASFQYAAHTLQTDAQFVRDVVELDDVLAPFHYGSTSWPRRPCDALDIYICHGSGKTPPQAIADSAEGFMLEHAKVGWSIMEATFVSNNVRFLYHETRLETIRTWLCFECHEELEKPQDAQAVYISNFRVLLQLVKLVSSPAD